MADSIKFDNTEILDTTHVPRFIKHESAPERFLNLLDLPRENGAVLVNDRYGRKTIPVQGYLIGTSEADLESKIDIFKELFSRRNKNLDISWNGGTRRYVATCIRHEFNRDHFNIGHVPWTAEFVVPSGVGENTTETSLIALEDFSNTWTDVWTFDGSAPPKPRITIAPQGTSATCLGIAIKNLDNGQRMVIPVLGGLSSGANIELDCRLKTVKVSSVVVPYYGQFPEFIVGANNVEVQVGNVIDQSWSGIEEVVSQGTGYYLNNGYKLAQSFRVDNSASSYKNIYAKICKLGSPSGDMALFIQEDKGGFPDPLTNIASGNFAAQSLTADTPVWTLLYSGAQFSLTAGKTYWLVLSAETVGSAGNKVIWSRSEGTNALYKRGNGAYFDSSTWFNKSSYDFLFKINYMGEELGTTCKGSVDYCKKYL
jgi:hypothetical protein